MPDIATSMNAMTAMTLALIVVRLLQMNVARTPGRSPCHRIPMIVRLISEAPDISREPIWLVASDG
jgi:hypothetical protein